jgi:hypothetical protein
MPKPDLGNDYSTFLFDWFFAGFESNEERARDKVDKPDEERRELARFGRLVGYQEMYVPPESAAPSSPVIRIFTLVGLFRDAAGASGYLAGQAVRAGGTTFDVGALGDKAQGFRAVTRGQNMTRVNVQRGHLLGTVGINRRDQTDVSAEALALGRKLDERMQRALRGELRGYRGPPGSEIGAERVELMTLPKADLGAAFSSFEDEIGNSGFQDNEERTQIWSMDGASDLAEFNSCGRVTGYFNAYIPTDDRGFVSSGSHLLSDEAGARGLVEHFVAREKRLEGRSIGESKVGAVSEVAVPGLGDQAAGVRYSFTETSRVTLLFRRGRVVGEVTLIRRDPKDLETDASAIGRKLDERIQAVLSGRVAP